MSKSPKRYGLVPAQGAVKVPLRKTLYVKIGVDTQDNRLEILGEECFATPDPDPSKPGVSKYTFIKDV